MKQGGLFEDQETSASVALSWVAKDALVVANHSGGKDSQAMLIKLLGWVPKEQLLVVHAPLGDVEWPGALEHAQKQAGQELHPAYASGNERLSCVFCIMASANDLRNGAIRNPELYQRYVELEQRTGYTMHQSRRSLPEITGVKP